jgi:hypothetical protein
VNNWAYSADVINRIPCPGFQTRPWREDVAVPVAVQVAGTAAEPTCTQGRLLTWSGSMTVLCQGWPSARGLVPEKAAVISATDLAPVPADIVGDHVVNVLIALGVGS